MLKLYKYEITDKGREKLQEYRESSSGGAANMAEGEILYWLDRSSEEGNAFINNNRDTWRMDGLGSTRRKGYIERVEED